MSGLEVGNKSPSKWEIFFLSATEENLGNSIVVFLGGVVLTMATFLPGFAVLFWIIMGYATANLIVDFFYFDRLMERGWLVKFAAAIGKIGSSLILVTVSYIGVIFILVDMLNIQEGVWAGLLIVIYYKWALLLFLILLSLVILDCFVRYSKTRKEP